MKTLTIDYRDDDVSLKGFCAYPETLNQAIPAVLVVHDWSGRNEFACEKAKKLAELGYIGFALDMYGDAEIGETNDEKSQLMQPLIHDRVALQKRILAAFETVKKLERVDTSRIAVIGFCFGGLCALDLARSGADIKGAVSFHGLLNAPEHVTNHPIKAKILALHGYADPMVTPDHVTHFANEMTRANVDWRIDMFGHVMHGFTNPKANDPSFGAVYHKTADSRAWLAMRSFLEEIFQ